jgi:hypothetical protein
MSFYVRTATWSPGAPMGPGLIAPDMGIFAFIVWGMALASAAERRRFVTVGLLALLPIPQVLFDEAQLEAMRLRLDLVGERGLGHTLASIAMSPFLCGEWIYFFYAVAMIANVGSRLEDRAGSLGLGLLVAALSLLSTLLYMVAYALLPAVVWPAACGPAAVLLALRVVDGQSSYAMLLLEAVLLAMLMDGVGLASPLAGISAGALYVAFPDHVQFRLVRL